MKSIIICLFCGLIWLTGDMLGKVNTVATYDAAYVAVKEASAPEDKDAMCMLAARGHDGFYHVTAAFGCHL